MHRRFGVSAAWVVATVVSILLASAAVATVRSEISERPSPLRTAALDQLASSTTATPPAPVGEEPPTAVPSSTTTAAQTAQVAPSTTVSSAPSTTSDSAESSTEPGQSTSTTIGSASVTTTTRPPVVTTSTTVPHSGTSSTTSTTIQAQGEPQSFEMIGGFVQIFVFPDSVVVGSTTPKPGFSVEIKKAGPPAVELRFEGKGHTSLFKADFEGGVLDVDLDEQEKGGKD